MPILQNTPLSSVEDLIEFYHQQNPNEELYVGIELERSGVYRDTQDAVPYDGDQGYQAIFAKLREEVGWESTSENNGIVYEMQRGQASLTIEADGRPELAGSPREHLHELSREFRLHDNELKEIGNIFNIGWLPIGMEPFHPNEDIRMIPKKRYEILQNFSNTQWMKNFLLRNNGVHVNFSYRNEENMVAKVQTAFRILPIISAMYASSPFDCGSLGSHLCMRRYTNALPEAPNRTRLPQTLLSDSFSFEEWIHYYLQLPVIIIVESEKEDHVPPKDLTFGKWIQEGYQGRKPTPFDFDQHVKTCWSDIRLRQSYLEYRVADSTPEPLAMSLPALLKGLVFDSSSWDAVRTLTQDWSFEEIINADKESWKTGLQTMIKGRPLLSYAQELIILANEKLHGFDRTEATEDTEAVYLHPIKEQIFLKEQSPAEELRSLYEREWNGDITKIISWCENAGQ